MQYRTHARILWPSTLSLLAALAFVGCVPRFAYVVDSKDDSVSVYAIDNAAGRLRSLGYTPTGTNPRGIAFRPDGRFAYVVNAGTAGAGSVSAYAADPSTGTLARLDADSTTPGIQNFPTGPDSRGLAIRGAFLFVANFGLVSGGTGSVSAFAIDPTGGLLTPIAGSPFAAGINPVGIVSDGTFIYVLNGGAGTLLFSQSSISAYSVASNGALVGIDANPASPTIIDNFVTSRTPVAIALRHDGHGILVANGDLATISVYDIDAGTGALARIDADAATAGIQDFAVGWNPWALASANGFVYAANRTALTTGVLATLRHSAGALTRVDMDPATPNVDDLPLGTTPAAVGIAYSTRMCGFFGVCSRNEYVYAANLDSHDIDTFSTDNFSTGAMSAKPDAPPVIGRRGPIAIATTSGRSYVSILPRRAFVAHAGLTAQGVVWSYDVDPSTGALTQISTAHIGPEGGFAGSPNSLTANADGKFVYAVRSLDGLLASYSVNPSTGVLGVAASVTTSFGSSLPAGGSPTYRTQIVIDPSQRFLYYETNEGLTGFSIEQTNGALTPLQSTLFYCCTTGHPLVMHPSGRFLYSGEYGTVFEIDKSTGLLTKMGRFSAMNRAISDAVIDPSGRFIYATGLFGTTSSIGDIGILAGRIDANTGTATGIDADPATPEFELYHFSGGRLFMDPRGRFLFVGAATGITVLRIDSASGALTPVDANPGTTAIDAFATESFMMFSVEPNGRYLYVPQFTSNGGIFVYSIDPTSGALSPIDADPGTPGKQGYPSSFSPTAIAFWSEVK